MHQLRDVIPNYTEFYFRDSGIKKIIPGNYQNIGLVLWTISANSAPACILEVLRLFCWRESAPAGGGGTSTTVIEGIMHIVHRGTLFREVQETSIAPTFPYINHILQ